MYEGIIMSILNFTEQFYNFRWNIQEHYMVQMYIYEDVPLKGFYQPFSNIILPIVQFRLRHKSYIDVVKESFCTRKLDERLLLELEPENAHVNRQRKLEWIYSSD